MQLHSRAYALLKRKKKRKKLIQSINILVSKSRTSEVQRTLLSYIIHKRCIALGSHMLAEFRSSHFSAINSDNCISHMLLNRHPLLPSQEGEVCFDVDYKKG